MTQRLTIRQTEQAVIAHVGDREVDLPAMHAISSLYRAASATRKHLTARVLRPRDLSWTGFTVLWTVWIWGPLETRETAESAGISKATLSGVVNTLERRGWIRRLASATDGRLVELELTDAGRELMDDLHPEFNRAEAELAAGLSKRRLEEMTKGLRALVERIEELEAS